MKRFLLFWIFILMVLAVFAQGKTIGNSTNGQAQREPSTHVTAAQAMDVGYAFMHTGSGSKSGGTQSGAVRKQSMQLVYTGRATDSLTRATTDCYYVFALQPIGFVIVAADERVEPILGYSYDNDFVVENMPEQVRGWLGGYEKQIKTAIDRDVEPATETTTKWSRLKSGQPMSNTRNGNSVGPLLTTQWGQTGLYGSMCPNGIVGCVGVAVAQIMNYWQYPEKGIGHIDFAGHEATFNDTYYRWDSLSSIPDALPTLMYHAAMGSSSLFMSSATGSTLWDASHGLNTFFDYFVDTEIKDDHPIDQWISMMKDNLNYGMPLLYDGGAHAWVCDGYDEEELFHMNWGWDGSYDGFYALDNLYVGLNDFNGYSVAVFGIHPAYSSLQTSFDYSVEDTNSKLIHFYDFSKNNPDNYLWNFGDGSTSTQINPSHLYDSAGLFEVSLTVEKDGVSESYSQTIKVNDYLFFKEVPSNLKNLKGSGIALDYNMDGLQDLFWFDYENGKFSVYKNCDSLSSAGYSFEHIADFTKCYATSNFTEMAQVVDFNNKNMPSVLYYRYALSPYLGTYWYLIGNNNGNMERDESYVPSFFHHCFAGRAEVSLQKDFGMFEVLDYDNDGLMDLAAGDTLFKNIGNGLFCPIDTILTHGVGTWIDVDGDGDFDVFPRAWMDIDKDGDVDIFSTNGVYINNGVGCFQHFQIPSGIADDFDGDGQIEILRHNTFYKGNFVSFAFDSLIVETEEDDIYMNLSNARYRIPADINNDGIVDIIASDVFTETSAIYNYHEDTVARYELNFDLDVRTPTWIDYDNNGSIDIIRPYQVLCDSRTHLFKNTMNNNQPPTAPTNLSVETLGNTAILHWNTSMDDHTNSGALTYNIAVGSAPDSCDIYSPLSNLETGKRYAVNKGNAGMGTIWRINDLPNGTYYWRVQAIDQAFAASPFSEMGVFTISGNNIPPAMAPITMNCYLNDSVLFSKSEFIDHYSDRDKDTMQSLIITSLPVYGKLYLYGNPVTENQIISINDIDSLCLTTTHVGDDIMRLKPFDGHDWSNLETPVRIHTSIFKRDRTFPNISGDVAWGDFDNDGEIDFASTSGIYHNTGSDFERLSDSVPPAEHVVWADVNDDGLLDCIFDGHVLINTGTGHFTLDVSLVEWTETGVAVGDINNDNRVDYVISGGNNQNEPQTRLFYNQGSGFAGDSASYILQGYRTGDISIGDYNNDGRQDIVLDGIYDGNSRKTSIYRNDQTSLAAISHDIPGINVGSVSWGDFDLDGDLDLLVCGSKGTTDNTFTAIYENYGGNVFIEHVRSTFASAFRGEAVWYDYDNDGYLDVLVSGINSGTKLYRNLYGEQFELVSHTGLPDLTFSSIDVVDYDGDGYEDIILSGVNDENLPYISVYHNGFGVNAIAQSVPSNLLAEVSGSSVILSWNDTMSSTYNIYVCDSQGFYMSPLADTVTGFRKITDNGNVGYSKNYTLRGLPAGSYYWGVQAIDKSHKGGAFAKGQAFTIECSNQETTVIYDTTCKYRQDGVYFEYYLNINGCDSIVERHVTVREDCKDVFYVRQDGSPDNSGYSWDRAISDLQVAINLAAEVNGQVWVAQGIYYGDSVSENAFTIPGGVQVYGGFEGNEPAGYDLSLRDFTAHPCILDGQYSQRTVYHSWYGGETSLLDGFIIQNGFATNEGGNVMGGYPQLQVSNCIIRNGEASEDAGGAAYAIVTNSVIYNNIGYNWAGGISNCSATNCILVNNTASVSAAVSSIMTNCILWNNGGWDQELSNTFTYSAIQNWSGGGEWNISLAHNNDGTSPDSNYVRFVDPENGDFRLAYESACINTGTPDISGLGLPSVDLQGLPRVLDGRIDMGAYEYYPVPVVETYDTICEGGTLAFFDSICAVEGQYLHHTSTDVTQDTLYILHLTINHATNLAFTVDTCDWYAWNGETYTTSGIYYYTHADDNNCTQVDTLYLTINHAANLAFTVDTCDWYTWNGETYTTSGTYYYTHADGNNCTQVDTLYLTINHATNLAFTVDTCDWYTWNGETYTTSGTYYYTHADGNNCTQVDTLYLTINHATNLAFTVDTCERYTWNGETYTTSGTYYYTHADGNNCTQVDTLYLTITRATNLAYTVDTCDWYTWHGETYTASGTYYYTHANNNNCTQVDTLYLTINHSAASDEFLTISEDELPYHYVNGQIDTIFPIGSPELLSINYYLLTEKGCDSIVTLHLTITPYDTITLAVNDTLMGSVALAGALPEGATDLGNGSYRVPRGSEMSIKAVFDAADFGFLFWTIDNDTVSMDTVYTFTVTESSEYTAHIEYLPTPYFYVSKTGWATWVNPHSGPGAFTRVNVKATDSDQWETLNYSSSITSAQIPSFMLTDSTLYTVKAVLYNYEQSFESREVTFDWFYVACDHFEGVSNFVGEITDQGVALSWDAGEGPQQYLLYRNYSIIDTLTTTSYLDPEGVYSNKYYVRRMFGGSAVCPYNNDSLSMSCQTGARIYIDLTLTTDPPMFGTAAFVLPDNTGHVAIGGTCTVSATANEGYSFTHWTFNGTKVSVQSTYSFDVEQEGELVAHFEYAPATDLYVSRTGWASWNNSHSQPGDNSCVSAQVTLKSIDGQVLFTQTFSQPSANHCQLPTGNFADSTLYLMSVVLADTAGNSSEATTQWYYVACDHLSGFDTVSGVFGQQGVNLSWDYPSSMTFTTATVDYDLFNGFVTDTAVMSNGGDASWAVEPQSTAGPYCNYASNVWVGDRITLSDTTRISEMEVYAFQNDFSTTSPFTGLYIQIYQGSPADSVLVWGNADSNLMTATAFTGCYRGLESNSMIFNLRRPIMSLTASGLDIELSPGTYYFVWSVSVSNTINPVAIPHCEPVVGNTGDYGMLYTEDHGWHTMHDGGSGEPFGFAFHLTGEQVLSPVVEPEATAIYRNGELIDITSSTTYTDSEGSADHSYEVRVVYGGDRHCVYGNAAMSMSCPQPVTLHCGETFTGDTTAVACESFTWYGTTYTETPTVAPTHTLTNASGCDSVVTLHLTINTSVAESFEAIACDSYTWNGETYTESGDYIQTFTAVNGCDSVVTLHLTVNPSFSIEAYLTISENDLPFTYGDTTFMSGTVQSGDYIFNFTTADGCDSVIILHLTVETGINDYSLNASMKLYPNPTKDLVNVQLTINNEQLDDVVIQLFDVYGKMLDAIKLQSGTSLQTQIDLSRYANGVYLIKAVAEGNVLAVRKVVKR